ncbi:MAG: hypothetical protein U0Q15_04365 [Kineosporiaceae bacterium]
MSPTRAGILIAAALTGLPLYRKVEAGQLDLAGALVRGLLVAIVCAMGIRWIQGLISDYAAQMDTKARAIDRFLDEADATDLAAAEAALRRMEAQQGPAALPRDGAPDKGAFQPMVGPDN